MKVFFYAYGWRDVANWSCPDCKNFWTCGADIAVEESRKTHEANCPAKIGLINITLTAEGARASGKTRMLNYLARVLKASGFEVTGHHLSGNRKDWEKHIIKIKGRLY